MNNSHFLKKKSILKNRLINLINRFYKLIKIFYLKQKSGKMQT